MKKVFMFEYCDTWKDRIAELRFGLSLLLFPKQTMRKATLETEPRLRKAILQWEQENGPLLEEESDSPQSSP